MENDKINIRLPYNKGQNVFVFNKIKRQDVVIMQKILRDFEPDQRDGFVSSVSLWVESQCRRAKAKHLIKDIETIITDAYSETTQLANDINQLLTISKYG